MCTHISVVKCKLDQLSAFENAIVYYQNAESDKFVHSIITINGDSSTSNAQQVVQR